MSVRGILGALEYRVVIWQSNPNRDSQDTDVTDQTIPLKNIESWFIAQPGFISLEHDISTLTVGTAIKALSSVKAKGSVFPLKIKTIANCLGDFNGYQQVSNFNVSKITPNVWNVSVQGKPDISFANNLHVGYVGIFLIVYCYFKLLF